MADILIKDLNINSTQKAIIVLDYGRAYIGHGAVDIEPQKSKEIKILDAHGPLTDINKLKDKFRRAAEVCEATNKPERAKHWKDAEALVNKSEVILESTEEVEETT